MTINAGTPMYAPWISLLRNDSDHLSRSPAFTYRSLAPFYVGQFTETACSVASATMVINAIRACLNPDPGPDTKPVTQQDVLEAVNNPTWRAGVDRDDGSGATLRELAVYLEVGVKTLAGSAASVLVAPVTELSAATADSFRQSLSACEAHSGEWVISNYYMEGVIGAGDYGHFSPVGAYDATRDRVLILDVYRRELEPYWVPADRLLAGMATPSRGDGEPRGYLAIRLPGC